MILTGFLPANMGYHENRISNIYISLTQYGEYVVRSDRSEKKTACNCLVTREKKQAVLGIENCKRKWSVPERTERAACKNLHRQQVTLRAALHSAPLRRSPWAAA